MIPAGKAEELARETYADPLRARAGQPIVGILGGMGPAASHAFLGHLINETPAQRDQDHIHVLLDCFPQIPDRTDFLTGKGPDPVPLMLAGVDRLTTAGAGIIVMPCNSACFFRERLIAASGADIVDWIAVAADVPGCARIGLLATAGTYRARTWQRALERNGMSVLVPGRRDQDRLMTVIYGPRGVKSGRHGPGELSELGSVAAALARRGAEQLLLACTELPLLMPAAASWWPVPAVDPAIAVARHVVGRARAAVRG
jgi:aspartate racemase